MVYSEDKNVNINMILDFLAKGWVLAAKKKKLVFPTNYLFLPHYFISLVIFF